MNNKPKTKKIEAGADYTDITTGEVITGEELINRLEKIKTDKQKDKEEEIKEREKSKHYITTHLGNFYFLIYGRLIELDKENNIIKGLEDYEARFMVRYLRLCCEMDYDSGVLVKATSGKIKMPLKKREVQAVIDVGDVELSRTLSYLKKEKLIIEEEGVFKINNLYSSKGKLNIKPNEALDLGVIRVFLHGYRYVYDNMNSRQRITLYNLIKLIPLINIDYNIICHNPLETEYYKIKPLSTMEIRKIFTNDNKTSKKILDDFVKFSIAGRGILMLIKSNGGEKYIFNPALMYGGNVKEKLETIEKLMNNKDSANIE